jgi:calcineurin-like phosphoesterase family protein
MSEVYFTADTHFGHSNILHLCNRPWNTIEEHDEALVDNWNSKVRPRDRIYVVGDFSFRADKEHAGKIFRRLNGSKFLVEGNHDTNFTKGLGWGGVVEKGLTVKASDHTFVLNHYPERVWNHMHNNSIHLYGHVHGRLPGIGLSMDVGVDPNDYKPLHSLEVIDLVMRNAPYFPELPSIKREKGSLFEAEPTRSFP